MPSGLPRGISERSRRGWGPAARGKKEARTPSAPAAMPSRGLGIRGAASAKDRAGGGAPAPVQKKLAGSRQTLSHVDRRGRVKMVDVGDKPVTAREAIARGTITMSREAL